MSEGMRRVRFTVSGDVQGVGYRAFARERAAGLGLAGWVMNRFDGRVEGEAEGPAPVLDAFLRELRRGPVSAQVDRVGSHDIPVLGERGAFRIARERPG